MAPGPLLSYRRTKKTELRAKRRTKFPDMTASTNPSSQIGEHRSNVRNQRSSNVPNQRSYWVGTVGQFKFLTAFEKQTK